MDNMGWLLIISDETDSTTDDVIDWLKYNKIKHIRINGTDLLSYNQGFITNKSSLIEINFKDEILNISRIKSYWYRRGRINLERKYLSISKKELEVEANITLNNEFTEINKYIHLQFKNNHGIGSIYHNKTNKLQNLEIARNIGLKIPDTGIFTSKNHLLDFSKRYKNVLTKSIGQAGLVYNDNEISIEGTSTIISEYKIKKLPNQFPPSLFQGYIEKAYELRIFYLDGTCYSSAIFSQLDDKTKIDFRNYNHKKPNRTPPYILPTSISEKIVSFMKAIDMNSGSIDIIVTPKKEYVFLEVNPVGQFFQVSYPCNYYLEKKVADFLSKPFKDEQKN